MEGWIALGIVVGLILLFVVFYNRIIALEQTRHNAFSDIDVQLKLRYDLVPNLIETVKGYAAHENEVFTKVTEARASAMQAGGNVEDRIQAEGILGGALMNLMAVAENYPDLKADSNFQSLQAELSDIENKIAAARRFFNNTTNEFNTYIKQIPANMVASVMGRREQSFFELSAEEEEQVHKAPEVAF